MTAGTEISEEHILASFHAKSEIAYRQIFDRYYGQVVLYACNLLNNAKAAEEITADSFLKAFTDPQKFPTLKKLEGFLYIATRNACFHHTEKEKVVDFNKQLLNYRYQSEGKIFDCDEFFGIDEALTIKLYESYHELPEGIKKVVHLRYLKNYSIKKTARIIGIEEGTVRNHATRGLKRLRNALLHFKFFSISILLIY